jgi:hypothetical protein
MTAMRGDVVNRVKRLPKPSKVAEALQPLFEAVSNATHAVEEAFLTLWDGELELMTEGSTRPITSVVHHAGIVKVQRYDFDMP